MDAFVARPGRLLSGRGDVGDDDGGGLEAFEAEEGLGDDQLLEDGLTRADIAIVSAVGQKRGALATATSLGPHRLVRAVDPALEREI